MSKFAEASRGKLGYRLTPEGQVVREDDCG